MGNLSDTIKQAVISDVMNDVGWIYHSMKWLDASEAKRANALYQNLVTKIAARGIVSFCGSKLHLGSLSKGCRICGGGSWSCLCFTLQCNANCFFCPQSRTYDSPPYTCNILFKRPNDYVDFLDRFGFSGASFSGGDPLILTDKLVKYIKAIKKRFGDKMYVWAYTGGKLVNKHRLALLQRAGLDELRIDIAAIDYNLDPVILAKKYIKTVTVEIPAIPEDQKILLKTLHSLDRAAVDHLNIHELRASPINLQVFRDRGYTFLHNKAITVLESNFTALKCLEYALDHDIRTPINFCTYDYKSKLQLAAYRNRVSPKAVQKNETITKSGYIRLLYAHDNHAQLAKLAKHLIAISIKKSQWSWDKLSNIIVFNPSIIEMFRLLADKNIFYIQYFEPYTSDANSPDSSVIELNSKKRVYIRRTPYEPIGPFNMFDLKLFKALYVDRITTGDIRKIRSLRGLTRDSIAAFKKCFAQYEDVREGFAEIF